MTQKAFQDYYPEDDQFNLCWGCGRNNHHGFKIKSYWKGDEAICRFIPEDFHMAAPGILNGGVIATIIDCHSTLTAIAAVYRAAGRELGTKPHITYVTASLEINYLRPTPIEQVILRARAQEQDGKRITVNCSLYANGEECVRAVVVAARVPANFIKRLG